MRQPSKTEGLVSERSELKERGLSQSRGDEARRDEDTKRENRLRETYLAAENELDRILRAHQGGQASSVDVAEVSARVKEAWSRYYKSKTGKTLRKSVEATIGVSEGEVELVAYGEKSLAEELPEILEKAARQIKGDEPVQIGEPGFFSNKHIQRLYWLFAKKGILMLREIESILERTLAGLKMETKAKLKKSNIYLLEKAIKPLSMTEIQELVDEVLDHSYSFSVNFLGFEPPTKMMLRLKQKGLLLKDKFSFPVNAYTFQRVSDILVAAGKRPDKVPFKQMLEMARHVPLTRFERDQVAFVEREAARHVTGLGEGIASTLKGTAEEAHQIMRYRTFIRETARGGLINRWSWKDLSSELGRRTGDWARDWDRIARTELQNATLDASAIKITNDNDGRDPLVYKLPRRNACRYCVALYLREGDFKKPRIFHLSTLVANGSNVGKKVAQWRPTKGIIHPHCNCNLYEHVGELGGKIETGPMGDLQAEEFSLYGRVKPRPEDAELAKKLLSVKVTLDGIPIEELR